MGVGASASGKEGNWRSRVEVEEKEYEETTREGDRLERSRSKR